MYKSVRCIWFSLVFMGAAASAFGEQSLIPGIHINQKYHMENKSPATPEGKQVFLHGPTFDAEIRTLSFQSPEVAERTAKIEYLNVKNLFEPRQNPYPGQITQLVRCQKELSATEYRFKLGERTLNAILGGANARKQIGACARAEISYWAAYYSVVTNKNEVVNVRLFVPLKTKSKSEIEKASRQLKEAARDLLSLDGK